MPNLKQIFLSVTLVVIAELILKYSLKGVSFSKENIAQFFISALTNPLTLFGFFLIGMSSIIWISTLSKTDLSYAYPFVSVGYAIVTILSALLLKESLSQSRIMGVVIIGSGIFLMSRS